MSEEIDRTVVLLGRTGGGKSSIAKALAKQSLALPTNVSDGSTSQTECFQVSDGTTSETRRVESHTLDLPWSHDESRGPYKIRVVDTIGIGDTKLSTEEVLLRLANACHECKNGINAILFVIHARMTESEASAFDLLWKALFGVDVVGYIVIVRTHFPKFRDKKAVKADQEKLKKEKGTFQRVLDQGISHNILYVDVTPDEYDRPNDAVDSANTVLDYLITRCEKVFFPPELRKVHERVSEHVETERKVSEKLEALQDKLASLSKDNKEYQQEHIYLKRMILQLEKDRAEADRRASSNMRAILPERPPGGLFERLGRKVDEINCSIM